LAGCFNSPPLGFNLILSLFYSAHNSNIHQKNGKIKQKTKIAHKSCLYQTILSNYSQNQQKNQQEKNANQTAAALPASTGKIFFANFSSQKRKAEAIHHLSMSFFSDA